MSNFVDLVICENAEKNIYEICEAPSSSFLKEGDNVLFDYNGETIFAEVKGSVTIEENGDKYNFIKQATSSEFPKITEQVVYRKMEYR